MTKFKLLKDLPFAKAGEIFDDENMPMFSIQGEHYEAERPLLKRGISASSYETLSEWFEPIVESDGRLDSYFKINSQMEVVHAPDNRKQKADNCFNANNYFETKEQAEQARDVILETLKLINDHNTGKCGCEER